MLDFTTTKKKFLKVKLIDGNVIMVRMPTKKVFDLLEDLKSNLTTLKVEDTEKIAEVYDMTAEILSNNLQNKKIDSDYLSEIFDMEDISILFTSYVDFVLGRVSNPNLDSPQSLETEGINNITSV